MDNDFAGIAWRTLFAAGTPGLSIRTGRCGAAPTAGFEPGRLYGTRTTP